MTETTTPETIRDEYLEDTEIPSPTEIQKRMTELEQRGVPTVLPCAKCDESVETTVPPEETDDEDQKTICRECAESHLRKKDLL